MRNLQGYYLFTGLCLPGPRGRCGPLWAAVGCGRVTINPSQGAEPSLSDCLPDSITDSVLLAQHLHTNNTVS